MSERRTHIPSSEVGCRWEDLNPQGLTATRPSTVPTPRQPVTALPLHAVDLRFHSSAGVGRLRKAWGVMRTWGAFTGSPVWLVRRRGHTRGGSTWERGMAPTAA